MDNSSDDYIEFDENGYCNYCNTALSLKDSVYFPNAKGEKLLNELIERLKKENSDKEYDCIMGISGGLDSAYLAYLGATKWNLRILAVHIDDGFDTDLAKQNIKNLCEKANIKLVTIKPDKKQFVELTRAYVLAEVPNLAVPQDNVLFAELYSFAKREGIRNFLSGANFSLESILQKGNFHYAYDTRNMKHINKLFGRCKIDKLPTMSQLRKDIDSFILKRETLYPLNYIDYNKERALKELKDYCGFTYYEAKHLENTLTKFIQVYWYYHKFGIEKRKSHLSSLIVTGQMTREDAIEELKKEIYNPIVMEEEIDMILRELDIERAKFDEIMNRSGKSHDEYKTSMYISGYKSLAKLVPQKMKVKIVGFINRK